MANQYWAKAPTSEIANEIKAKMDDHYQWLSSTGYGPRIQSLNDAYSNYEDGGFGLQISQDRSSAKVKVNQLKSIVDRLHGMVTNAKLQFVPRASNSDSESQIQADFSKGLLEYYQDDKNMNEYTSELALRALVQLEGYIFAPFDKSQGIEFTKDENGRSINVGDQSFTCLSPFEVAKHPTQPNSPYHIVKIAVNKYDLAAEYPDQADEIVAMSAEKGMEGRDRIVTPFDTATADYDDDTVHKLILMHRRTLALPKGRYTEIVGDIVLKDTILPYKTVPIVRLVCSNVLGTVGGDSPATMLLSLQEVMDKLWSAVSTNNLASAKQNLHSTTDLDIKQLSDGQNLIVSPVAPTALQLTQSSPETYKLIDSMQVQQETLSGVNKTARGNPDSAVATAGGQALMLAQAVEFISDLQRRYARAAGELATIVIHNLQVFATEPQVAVIGGISRKSYTKTFQKEDVSGVDRVFCDIGNPMTQTITGRASLAKDWLDAGILKDPTKLNEFMRTGQLDSLTEDKFKDGLLIREENEMLRKGINPPVLIWDNHIDHFNEHKSLSADPTFRNNPQLQKALQDHEAEHLRLYKSMDPDMAAIVGLPPLPSQMGPGPGAPPPPPGNGPNMPPPDPTISGEPVPNLPQGTPEATAEAYDQYIGQLPPIGPDAE